MSIAPLKERIAKVMARSGLCSRREAEKWILEGRVHLNGILLESPAVTVGLEDNICVDGRPLAKKEGAKLWAYHKPAGLLTTHHDPEGRPTLFETLPPELGRVISVGRLDQNSEGLLLLTNDGDLARFLELPRNRLARVYKVRVYGKVAPVKLLSLKNGIEVDGMHYGPVQAELLSQKTTNAWVSVKIREGKNREVRKIMAHLGYPVNRLIRTRYGPFTLENLLPGEIEPLSLETLGNLGLLPPKLSLKNQNEI